MLRWQLRHSPIIVSPPETFPENIRCVMTGSHTPEMIHDPEEIIEGWMSRLRCSGIHQETTRIEVLDREIHMGVEFPTLPTRQTDNTTPHHTTQGQKMK